MNDERSADPGKIIIAIDGYSSCGKSTLAKALARTLHYHFIDSGSMYRAVTHYLVEHGISLDQLHSLSPVEMEALLDNIHITFRVNPSTGFSEVHLNGKNVESFIRELKVSDLVSPVSAIAAIRKRMVKLQQSYDDHKGIVMDGRDIGTKVFPHAELKIFMTANNAIRAKRRFDELCAKGYMVTMDEVYRNIEERDYADTHRSESPLRKADDAIVLDNSDMNEQQQLDFALNELKRMGVEIS
ncbi:MAG: (d)CMP kinase [Bacteroidetes bacterium]|nr:(d)CMP kinase [Bacteroidota bacterium]